MGNISEQNAIKGIEAVIKRANDGETVRITRGGRNKDLIVISEKKLDKLDKLAKDINIALGIPKRG